MYPKTPPRSLAVPCAPRPIPEFLESFTPSTPESNSPFSHKKFSTSPTPSSPFYPSNHGPCIAEANEDFKISNKVLGKGTYSQVRLASNSIGYLTAAKCIDLRTHENEYENEVFALSVTSHPNIVKMIYSTKRNRRTVGVLFIEYLPYPSLYQYISKKNTLSERTALHILKQLVEGVSHLHDKRLTHMDLKPENISIDEIGRRVIIFDLGLSLRVDPDKPLSQGLIGSPLYMAPEIIKHQHYDPRLNDVWSLGVILYEMITGNPPYFHCETMQDLLNHVEAEDMIIPEGITLPTRKILSKMLCFNPQNRPQILLVKKKLAKIDSAWG